MNLNQKSISLWEYLLVRRSILCKKIYVIFLCAFLAPILFHVAYSQVNTEIVLLDSIQVKLTGTVLANEKSGFSKLIHHNNLLFLLTDESKRLYKIDLQNGSIDSILPSLTNRKSERPILNFELGSNSLFIADSRIDFIREFDFNGNPLGRIRMNRQISRKFVSGRENLSYNAQRNSIFVNVDESSPERFMLSNPERALNYFRRNDLIVEINRSGKRVNYFGSFDSLYRKNLYFHGMNYSFSMNERGDVILSQELSNELKLYSTPYSEAKEVAQKGRYITKDVNELPVTAGPYISNEAYYHHVIGSYQYQNVNFLNNRNLCYRTYVDATTDSTELKIYPVDTQFNTDGKCKAPSLRMLDQLDILKSKKLFVQILDIDNSAKVYDGPFVFMGKFFVPTKDSKSDEFFTYDWKDGVFTLYRYKLQQE
jgi:hypothetical protein